MLKNKSQSGLSQQRFSIRKLTIGATSVLIGITFMSWNDQIVKADDINSAQNTAKVTAQQEQEKDQVQKFDTSEASSNKENKITTPADKASTNNAVVSKSDVQDKIQLNSLDTEKTNQLPKSEIKEQKTSIKQDAKSEAKDSDVQNNSKYNTDDWDGNLDQAKGEYTLTRYKGSDLDIYIPNTSDFIKAGKITDGEKVYVTSDLFKTINQSKATSVTIDPDGEKLYARGSLNRAFKGNQSLKHVDLHNLDTSEVTDMSSMFNMDKSLEDLDLSGWNTSNVTSMDWAVENNPMLKSANLSGWDLSKASISSLVADNGNLTNLNLSNVNFGVKSNNDTSYFVGGDNSLTTVNLAGAKQVPLSVIQASIKAAGKNGDTNLDLSQIGSISSSITNLNSLFQWNGNFETINVTGWNTGNITSMVHTFSDCTKLKKVIGLNTWDLSNVTNMNGMFYNDKALTDVDLSGRDLSKVTDLSAMFYGDPQVKSLNLSGVTFKDGVNDGMFQAIPSSLTSVNLANAKNVTKNILHYYMTAFTNSGATELDAAQFPASFQFTDWSWLLSSLSNVETINLSGFDFSNVTNLSNLFNNDSNLTSVDLHGANLSNVGDISNIFQKCPKLKTINLSSVTFNKDVKDSNAFVETNNIFNFDLDATQNIPEKVLRAYIQAAKNSKATQIDLSNLNLSKNVTNLQGLLSDLPDVKEINLSGLDISNIQKMDGMLARDGSLERVNLSGLDLSKVSLGDIFYADKKLSYLNLSGVTFPDNMSSGTFDNYFAFVSNKVFKEVKLDNAKNIPAAILHAYISAAANNGAKKISLDNLDVSKKITNFNGLFANLPSVETIDVTNLPTSNAADMSGMFSNDQNLTHIIGIEGFDTHNVTNMSNMFGAYYNPTIDDYEPQSLKYLGKLTNLDLSSWDTSNVTDMGFMFTGQKKLETIGDLSNWNTSKVTNMCNMFDHLKSLKDGQLAGLKNWDTFQVTDMTYMFDAVTKQTDLNFVDGWDTSNVTDMSYMFSDDPNLKSLDLSKWNVGKVGTKKTDQNYSLAMMFANDKALTTVGDISNWDTRNVHDTRWMFYKTKSLNNVDLSGWKTPKLQIAGKMFYGSGVQHVNMSNWDFSHLLHYNNYGFVNRTEGGEIFRGPEGMFAYLINRAVITMNNIKLPDDKNAFIVDDFAGTQPIAVLANDAQGYALPALMDLNKQQWVYKESDDDKGITVTGRQNSNVLTLVKANDSQLARDAEENPKIGEHKLNFVFRDKDDLTKYLNTMIAADEIKQDLKNYNSDFDLRTWDQKGDTNNNNLLKTSLRLYQPADDNFLADWVVPVYELHIVAPTVTTESKTITRTITVKFPDGKTQVEKQPVTFKRTVTTYKDSTIEKGAWDKGSGVWPEYTSPTVIGYTPSIKEFAQKTVTPKDHDENYVVTYKQDSSGNNGGDITPPTPLTPPTPSDDKPHTPEDTNPVPSVPTTHHDQKTPNTKRPHTKPAEEWVKSKAIQVTGELNAKGHLPKTIKMTNTKPNPSKAKLPQTSAKHTNLALISGIAVLGLLGLGMIIDHKKYLKQLQ